MDFFLNRYRDLTVLLIVIVAQLLLIAYQVKTERNIPLVRVWAVSAVTPAEQALEFLRRNTWGFVEDYFVLLGVRAENAKLHREVGDLKIENHYLKSQLSTADRVRALSLFQNRSPSKTVAARIIGNGTGANSKSVFVDRGSANGIEAGMAVVTPDGIVGKVLDAYPTASLVMLITDPTFAAGVISQKNRVHGTLKGLGHNDCLIDYVQNEQKVDVGEMFYTSGDDRIFPKGFPVGAVSVARNGKTFKEIYVSPSGFQGGLEEVLIVVEGVHQPIPEDEIASPNYKLLQPPPDVAADGDAGAVRSNAVLSTDADRLHDQYRQVGEQQNHVYGEGLPGSKPPDFTKLPGPRPVAQNPAVAPPKPAAPASATGTPPAASPASKPAEPPKSAAGANAAAGTDASTAPKAKPRPQGPLLVTDPADADPDTAAQSKPDKPPVKKQ
jgi:rod shape-determining protein MreC